jgi:hypothetical protein
VLLLTFAVANLDRGARTTWAGVAAVFTVQVVVGCWIYISWTEERNEPWNKTQDDKKAK